MLLRVGTGKQNEDSLALVKLGKTGWSTVPNVTKNRHTGLSSVALGQSDLVFKFFIKPKLPLLLLLVLPSLF